MQIAFPSLSVHEAFNLVRRCGYSPDRHQNPKEPSLYRRLGSFVYPRFHVYLQSRGSGTVVNLHLDQKQPSYAGNHAHSGEYEGSTVEREADRIRGLLT